MSYILDALRKSEQERQRGAAPGVLTVHAPAASGPGPGLLVYGSIGILLIGAGVAIGWWHPWRQARVASAPEPLVAELLVPRERPAAPEPLPLLPEPAPRAQLSKPMPKETTIKRPVERPVYETEKKARSGPGTASVAKKHPTASGAEIKAASGPGKAGTQSEAKPAAAAPVPAPEPGKVIQMAELPPAILQEIPPMEIPIHTYSTSPKERIVGINGRLLQEGDYLAPGLKVEQITPDGVIFSYKNYLFRHGLQ